MLNANELVAAAQPEARDEVARYLAYYPPSFGPCGEYAGLTFEDGSIRLDNSLSPREALSVYAHEVCHRTVSMRHDANFAGACWALQMRWVGESDAGSRYDMQDAYVFEQHVAMGVAARRAADPTWSPEADGRAAWRAYEKLDHDRKFWNAAGGVGLLVFALLGLAALAGSALVVWLPVVLVIAGLAYALT